MTDLIYKCKMTIKQFIIKSIVNEIEFNAFKFVKIGLFFESVYVVSKIFQKNSINEVISFLLEIPWTLLMFGLCGSVFGFLYGLNKNNIEYTEYYKYTIEIVHVITNKMNDNITNKYIIFLEYVFFRS